MSLPFFFFSIPFSVTILLALLKDMWSCKMSPKLLLDLSAFRDLKGHDFSPFYQGSTDFTLSRWNREKKAFPSLCCIQKPPDHLLPFLSKIRTLMHVSWLSIRHQYEAVKTSLAHDGGLPISSDKTIRQHNSRQEKLVCLLLSSIYP